MLLGGPCSRPPSPHLLLASMNTIGSLWPAKCHLVSSALHVLLQHLLKLQTGMGKAILCHTLHILSLVWLWKKECKNIFLVKYTLPCWACLILPWVVGPSGPFCQIYQLFPDTESGMVGGWKCVRQWWGWDDIYPRVQPGHPPTPMWHHISR